MSVASVFVDFVARTAGFQENVAQAANAVKNAGQKMVESNKSVESSNDKAVQSVEKGFLRVALGAHVYGLVRHEIADVIKNIEHIPGVPPETIASIQQMQGAFASARNTISIAAAELIGFINNTVVAAATTAASFNPTEFGKNIKAGKGLLESLRGSLVGADEGLRALHEDMEKALRLTPEYQTRLLQASEALTRAQQKLKDVGATNGEQIDNMMRHAAALRARSDNFAPNDIVRSVNPRTEAANLEADAASKMRTLNKELEGSYQRLGEAQNKVYEMDRARRVNLEDLRAREGELMIAMQDEQNSMDSEAVKTEKLIKLNEQLAQTLGRIAAETARIKLPTEMLRDTFIHSFQQMSDAMAQLVVNGKWQFRDLFTRSR